LDSFIFFRLLPIFGNPVALYLPSVLASGSHPVRLAFFASCCTFHHDSRMKCSSSLHPPLTMASHKHTTRHSLQQANCQVLPSSVYYERWENHQASREHLFLGKTAGTGHTRNNMLSCWEVNMGFVLRSPIPTDFNNFDSWKEVVTWCCHCTTFQGDWPLKKKVRKFASHHNDGLAELYQCQSLWAVHSGPTMKQNSRRPNLDTVSDVGFSQENPISISKKQKPAPSVAAKVKEHVGILEVAINQVTSFKPGVMQADIDKLETKLRISYNTRPSQYLEEIVTLQVQLASEKEFSSDRGSLALQNASLQEENFSLCQENSTLLAEVLQEKQRICKQVLALATSQARSTSCTFASKLEDCMKQEMTHGGETCQCGSGKSLWWTMWPVLIEGLLP
jgi:hypothetical protein